MWIWLSRSLQVLFDFQIYQNCTIEELFWFFCISVYLDLNEYVIHNQSIEYKLLKNSYYWQVHLIQYCIIYLFTNRLIDKNEKPMFIIFLTTICSYLTFLAKLNACFLSIHVRMTMEIQCIYLCTFMWKCMHVHLHVFEVKKGLGYTMLTFIVRIILVIFFSFWIS